jgi:hypothetical protein
MGTSKLVVRRVVSNLKGEVDVTFEADKALITGRNEAGKSAVTDSIFLALTGRVPDLGGKDEVAQPGQLMALAPGRKGELFAKVWLGTWDTPLDECAVVEWRTSGVEGRAKRPERIIPASIAEYVNDDAVMPLRELKALFSKGGVDKRRQFFFRHVVAQLSERDIMALVPHTVKTDFEQLAKSVGADGYTADVLLKMRTRANSDKNEAQGKLRDAETTLTTLAGVIESPPLDSEIEEAEAALGRAQADLRNFRSPYTGSTPAEYRAAADQVERDLTASRTQLKALETEGRGLDEQKKRSETHRARMNALALVTQVQSELLEQGQLSHCAACNHELADPATVEAFATRVKELAVRAATVAWSDGQEERLQTLRKEWARINSLIAAHAERPAALRAEAEKAAQLIEEDASRGDRSACEALVQSLTNRVMSMKRAANDYTVVRQARDRKGSLETQVDKSKRLTDLLDSMMTELLAKATAAFEKRVSGYLPKGDSFRLVLWEGEGKKRTETCLVGLEKADGLHTALSGAAWARVTTAVACVLADAQTLAVVVPEERAYDGATLRGIMAGLSNASAQVLITHPTKQSGRTPKGWAVIEIAEREETT